MYSTIRRVCRGVFSYNKVIFIVKQSNIINAQNFKQFWINSNFLHDMRILILSNIFIIIPHFILRPLSLAFEL